MFNRKRILPLPDFSIGEDSRKKEYTITPKGREALEMEVRRLRELVASGEKVLKEEEK